MLDSWASVAGMDTLAAELLDVLHSPKCTGDGKADGIGWLAKRVRGAARSARVHLWAWKQGCSVFTGDDKAGSTGWLA